ncbi:reverse transcriptase (RNA-dependent DNA polymerase) domain-containing protein [Phthorimaea operculella]|nr:reverse transcriptase (RNA-dependent DNA polymerase) domain-containing protein [Phthorimaea operculella]
MITGYTIPFVRKPPNIPLTRDICVRMQTTFTQEMSAEISKMVKTGVLRKAPRSLVSGHVSRIFLVPKSDGTNRPIFDLRNLNDYLKPKKFYLPSHFTVPEFLQKQDFMIKLDLSQAYFHVPVKETHQRYLSLYFQDQLYCMTCLPFGLSTAPIAFARISNWIATQLRKKNIRVIVYLDDFLLVNQSAQRLEEDLSFTVQFLINLGWKVNFQKSVLEPTQNLEFLGIGWNTKLDQKYIPQKKINSLRRDLLSLIESKVWDWHQAKSMLGSLNFVEFVVPLGRLHCRQIQIASKSLPENSPRKRFQIPAKVLQDMSWWLNNLEQRSEIFIPPAEVFLSTDASNIGWGAHIFNQTIAETWSTDQISWHINRKELYAVCKTIETFKQDLQNKTVLIQSDNGTVIAYVRNQGGTKSQILLSMAEKLLLLTDQYRIRILIRYMSVLRVGGEQIACLVWSDTESTNDQLSPGVRILNSPTAANESSNRSLSSEQDDEVGEVWQEATEEEMVEEDDVEEIVNVERAVDGVEQLPNSPSVSRNLRPRNKNINYKF